MSEKIEWTVEGQMLHRVAKRMEQEEERERIRGMRKLDCGCSVSTWNCTTTTTERNLSAKGAYRTESPLVMIQTWNGTKSKKET